MAEDVFELAEANWDLQLDRALMNAAAVLAEAPKPADLEEACGLAGTWMALADSWSRRVQNQLAREQSEMEIEYEEVE